MQSQSQSVPEEVVKVWRGLPFLSKVTLGIISIVYLIDLVRSIFTDSNKLKDSLANSIDTTILKGQVWRLFTAFEVHSGIFELGLVVYFVIKYFVPREREIGTLLMYIDIVVKNAQIQGVFLIAALFLYLIDVAQPILSWGLLPYCFLILTAECLKDDQGITMCLCLPFQIKKKYYPILLLIVINLIKLRVDVLAAFAIAHASQHITPVEDIPVFTACVQKLEESPIVTFLAQNAQLITSHATNRDSGDVQTEDLNGPYLNASKEGVRIEFSPIDNENWGKHDGRATSDEMGEESKE